MTDNLKTRNNKGYLYPNSNKTKATHPDYIGKVIIEKDNITIEKRLAAWENNDSSGKKYLSIVVSELVTNDNIKNKEPTSSVINDDLDELDKILNIADEDNPFDTN